MPDQQMRCPKVTHEGFLHTYKEPDVSGLATPVILVIRIRLLLFFWDSDLPSLHISACTVSIQIAKRQTIADEGPC